MCCSGAGFQVGTDASRKFRERVGDREDCWSGWNRIGPERIDGREGAIELRSIEFPGSVWKG